MLPELIVSLNVSLITLFVGTFTALFNGSVEFTVGATSRINEVYLESTYPPPV